MSWDRWNFERHAPLRRQRLQGSAFAWPHRSLTLAALTAATPLFQAAPAGPATLGGFSRWGSRASALAVGSVHTVTLCIVTYAKISASALAVAARWSHAVR